MPAHECIGKEIKNEVDEFLDNTEDTLSTDRGNGIISEDKFNEVIEDIESIRKSNNRIKCLVASIPRSSVEPESFLNELDKMKEE